MDTPQPTGDEAPPPPIPASIPRPRTTSFRGLTKSSEMKGPMQNTSAEKCFLNSQNYFCFQLRFFDHRQLFASPPDSSPEVPVPPRGLRHDGGRLSGGPRKVPGSRVPSGRRTSSLLQRPSNCHSALGRPSQVSYFQPVR